MSEPSGGPVRDWPVELFDFDLPEDRIALRPVRPRSAARMLVAAPHALTDATVADLPAHLRPGDLLVFNDTRVIPARLDGERVRGDSAVRVEANLIERLGAAEWRALARPGKRLREGEVVRFGALAATIVAKEEGGALRLRFDRSGPALDAAIAAEGAMPLPPYIANRRAADAEDRSDYQTLLADKDGAVAAPTAALHFDEALLGALQAAGVARTTVTLHVGAGTFLPVKAETTAGHVMHSEVGEIGAEAVAACEVARARGGRVVAVGTTALRVLETAARGGALGPWAGSTDIFITPGFRFRAVDGLMTNFHLPRSTLMMLVAAFVGLERMRAIYDHAVRGGYRFYSYGDASLLWPGPHTDA